MTTGELYKIPVKDKLPIVFLSKTKLYVSENCIYANDVPIPTSNIACLILGAGTSITNKVAKVLNEDRCYTIFTDQFGLAVYSIGRFYNSDTNCLQKQIRRLSHNTENVVYRMFYLRSDKNIEMKKIILEKNINKIRGYEGSSVKKIYTSLAKEYNIEWSGRNYYPERGDIVNLYLNIFNNYLYSICEACIISMGFSPSIGFIHSGNSRSFVFDIADIFKFQFSVPLAFELASTEKVKIKNIFSNRAKEFNLTSKITDAIDYIFVENKH